MKSRKRKGVRHFRVVNVGAWADVALGAIDRAAEAYGGDSSVPRVVAMTIISTNFGVKS